MIDLDTDLSCIADLTAARQDEFEILLYQLQLDDKIDDARLDALVEAIAAPVRQAIDCTLCANCCRRAGVYVTPADIQVLADGIGRSADEITARYVATPNAGSEMALHSCPAISWMGDCVRFIVLVLRPAAITRLFRPIFAGRWKTPSPEHQSAPSSTMYLMN